MWPPGTLEGERTLWSCLCFCFIFESDLCTLSCISLFFFPLCLLLRHCRPSVRLVWGWLGGGWWVVGMMILCSVCVSVCVHLDGWWGVGAWRCLFLCFFGFFVFLCCSMVVGFHVVAAQSGYASRRAMLQQLHGVTMYSHDEHHANAPYCWSERGKGASAARNNNSKIQQTQSAVLLMITSASVSQSIRLSVRPVSNTFLVAAAFCPDSFNDVISPFEHMCIYRYSD